MSLTLDQIEAEARKLDDQDRAELAGRILGTFRSQDESRAEHDRIWADEALRRDREMEESGDPGVPSEEVLRRLRARLSGAKS